MNDKSPLRENALSGILTATAAIIALVWAVGGSVVNWTRSDSGADGKRDSEIAVLQDEMKSKADAGVLQVEIQTLQTEVQADEASQKQESAQIVQIQESVNALVRSGRR